MKKAKKLLFIQYQMIPSVIYLANKMQKKWINSIMSIF